MLSSWRNDPLVAFLGLAKGDSPDSSLLRFSFLKFFTVKKTSPRISTLSRWALSLRGMERMVLALSVTSSPLIPSPLVPALTSTEFS